jgi:hypothetical protein
MALVGTTAGRTPLLVNGDWKDGRSGEINVIRDGQIQTVQLNPGFMTQPLIDRYERGIRSSGVPAQFSGETPSNIATGRLGQNTLSATVDYPIQEYQEVIQDLLFEANRRAIAIARGYFGDAQKSFHVGFNRVSGRASYKPNTHFETDYHQVSYSAPGADLNSLVIGIGQRVGIGTMSKWTAMFQDPMIPDPEFEYQKVTSEALQGALLEFVSMQVAQGGIDPQDVLFLIEEIEKGEQLSEAWRKAQSRAQERQSEKDATAGAEMPPGMEPGLSGAEPQASIAPAPEALNNLSGLLGSLRQPSANMAPLGGDRNAQMRPVG